MRVKDAIKDVAGPGAETDYERNPCGKLLIGCPGESESPNNGDCGRVEAGEVPEMDDRSGLWFRRGSGLKGGQCCHSSILRL